jgi:hypothetical protein
MAGFATLRLGNPDRPHRMHRQRSLDGWIKSSMAYCGQM